MLFLFLIDLICCEIFQFKNENQTLNITLTIQENSINKGYFKAMPDSNMTYKVEMKALGDTPNILYKANKLEENKETYFSFNNTNAQNLVLNITSLKIDSTKDIIPGLILMKFESVPDTFNADVSKKKQIEPAIFAFEQLLNKANEVIMSSKAASIKMKKLGNENMKILKFVVFFSCLTLAAYIVFNGIQLHYMKAYLHEKKYL